MSKLSVFACDAPASMGLRQGGVREGATTTLRTNSTVHRNFVSNISVCVHAISSGVSVFLSVVGRASFSPVTGPDNGNKFAFRNNKFQCTTKCHVGHINQLDSGWTDRWKEDLGEGQKTGSTEGRVEGGLGRYRVAG